MSSPARAPVESNRRIYIAAKLTPDEIKTRYKDIVESFSFVPEPRNADLIVVDLGYPPDNLGAYFAADLHSRVPLFPEISTTPCLFVILGTTQHERSTATLDQIKTIFKIEPMVLKGSTELLRHLELVQSVSRIAIYRQVVAGERVHQ